MKFNRTSTLNSRDISKNRYKLVEKDEYTLKNMFAKALDILKLTCQV